ncbi:hypothetical protein HPB51_021409 [Rhipicephalus microplus]|uniref:Uncharacterized protein n=1 Tax=Rhipicephalus microplus TaxID=6941 RepID=A0A9J6F8Z1_RHIMP|nr:hypothetical protein HPB51_021409 [Rhipicephalus microplus]
MYRLQCGFIKISELDKHLWLIVLHSGSKKGFVEGARLVFCAKKASGDYHAEIVGNRFEWRDKQESRDDATDSDPPENDSILRNDSGLVRVDAAAVTSSNIAQVSAHEQVMPEQLELTLATPRKTAVLTDASDEYRPLLQTLQLRI